MEAGGRPGEMSRPEYFCRGWPIPDQSRSTRLCNSPNSNGAGNPHGKRPDTTKIWRKGGFHQPLRLHKSIWRGSRERPGERSRLLYFYHLSDHDFTLGLFFRKMIRKIKKENWNKYNLVRQARSHYIHQNNIHRNKSTAYNISSILFQKVLMKFAEWNKGPILLKGKIFLSCKVPWLWKHKLC